MMSHDDKYYKSMYHTLLRAAETSVDWIMDGKDPLVVVHILLQAMTDCEDLYVDQDIPTKEERELDIHMTE